MGKGVSIGIIAIKGGVGKTTVSINLAAVLANYFGKKVLLVDGNFSSPDIGLHLGFINSKHGIGDFLDGKKSIINSIYSHEFGFHFIPGALGSEGAYVKNGAANKEAKKINVLMLKQKLQLLKKYYDFILIDSSPSLGDELLSVMHASDQLFVVTTSDLPTLSSTLRAVRLAKLRKTPITGLILNKVRGKKYELDEQDIERLVNVPMVAVLEDNVKVIEALAKVRPITLFAPNSNVGVGYRKLGAILAGEEFKDPSKLARLWNWFKEDFDSFRSNRFSKKLAYYH